METENNIHYLRWFVNLYFREIAQEPALVDALRRVEEMSASSTDSDGDTSSYYSATSDISSSNEDESEQMAINMYAMYRR